MKLTQEHIQELYKFTRAHFVYHFDLQTGRAAKTATLYIDTTGEFIFKDNADCCIKSLKELL